MQHYPVHRAVLFLSRGLNFPEGEAIPLQVDWPMIFADGSAQTISVQGMPVQVTFEKIGDIP